MLLTDFPTPLALGALAGLSVVGTFCWCWRERSRRKTLLAMMREERKTLLALKRQRKPAGRHLERVRPPPNKAS